MKLTVTGGWIQNQVSLLKAITSKHCNEAGENVRWNSDEGIGTEKKSHSLSDDGGARKPGRLSGVAVVVEKSKNLIPLFFICLIRFVGYAIFSQFTFYFWLHL